MTRRRLQRRRGISPKQQDAPEATTASKPTGTGTSAARPTMASPVAITAPPSSSGARQRRAWMLSTTAASTPPVSTQTGQVAPVTAAAAMPTGAVSAAARWATARAVAGTTVRARSAATPRPMVATTRPANLNAGAMSCQLPATTMTAATSTQRAVGRRKPRRDRLGAHLAR